VLEDLVEHFRGGQPSPQVLRDRLDDGIVDLGEPPVGRDNLGHRTAVLLLQVRAEGGDIVQQPPGLVLSRVNPGSQEELAAVVARVRHPGPHAQTVTVWSADQLDLLGGESELVEAAQPLGDPEPLLVERDHLLTSELVP
jgi:hypothetical protein